MSELETLFETLTKAVTYLDIFGQCEDGETTKHVKRTYRRWARKLHPDRYSTATEKKQAQEAFKLLGAFHQKAKEAVRRGDYGKIPKLVIRSRKSEYEVDKLFAKSEIADLYQAHAVGSTNALAFKIARIPRDNELMAKEAVALKLLQKDNDPDFTPYFPELLDAFVYQDERHVQRRVNVMPNLEGWYNLEEIQAATGGISALDMAWIWRRLLWLLGYAHGLELIHGAVLPSHVMVLPEKHGVMLLDWCYSTTQEAGTFPVLSAVSSKYLDWYPKEVLLKEHPSFGTDLYLAAKSMVYVMGGENIETLPASVPRAFRAYFRGCLQENQKTRPQEAWGLLGEFDELLERMGKPYYPRKFHPFVVPLPNERKV